MHNDILWRCRGVTYTVVGLNSKRQYYGGSKENCHRYLHDNFPTFETEKTSITGGYAMKERVLPEPMIIKRWK